MKIIRGTPLYNYLNFCYKVCDKFLNSGSILSLEEYDFCKLVRMSLFVAPLILFTEFVLLPLLIWVAILNPIVMLYNPLNGLIFPAIISIIPIVVFVLSLLTMLFGNMIKERRNDKKRQNKESIHGQHSQPQPNGSSVGNFLVESYKSIKYRYCSKVEFM